MLTILIVVIVCSLLQTASFKCLPNISDSNKHNNDFGQIECEISTCTSISKIIFERVDINISTPVFMGINKTLYNSIHKEDYEYTLKNRSDYMSFPTKALLYIEPLILEDHGKWRCVVYDSNNRKYESQARDVVIYDIPSEETVRIEPTKMALVTDQIQEFRCSVDRIHPKPDVVWLMNCVTQLGGIVNNTQTDDGYWSVINTIAVKFHVEGANNLSCVIKTKVILIKNITLDIKAPARILDPQIGMLVQEVPFILNCSGSGFKPFLTWKRDGKSILDTNEKYKIQQKCSELTCEGSLSPALIGSMTNNSIIDEYLGVFTCVIELDSPYKSFQESQYMAVYMPQAQRIEHTKGYKVGMFVFIAICILQFSAILVWTIPKAYEVPSWKNKTTQHQKEIELRTMSGGKCTTEGDEPKTEDNQESVNLLPENKTVTTQHQKEIELGTTSGRKCTTEVDEPKTEDNQENESLLPEIKTETTQHQKEIELGTMSGGKCTTEGDEPKTEDNQESVNLLPENKTVTTQHQKGIELGTTSGGKCTTEVDEPKTEDNQENERFATRNQNSV